MTYTVTSQAYLPLRETVGEKALVMVIPILSFMVGSIIFSEASLNLHRKAIRFGESMRRNPGILKNHCVSSIYVNKMSRTLIKTPR
jgi:hypothetical protein